MLKSLRDGSWATAERLRIYPLMLAFFYALTFAAIILTSHNLLDWMNRPVGTDFSQVWVSGKFVLNGLPTLPYDNDALFAAEREVFGSRTDVFAWGYPPYFLAYAALVALVPYLPALLLSQAGLGFALLKVMRRILPQRGAIPLMVGFPVMFINVTHGHNGFLTAALLAGALLVLDRKPMLAGFLFACLAYKPQYGLLVPLALACGGYWRAFASAAASFVMLTIATIIAWGTGPWHAFADSLTFSRVELLEQGNTGFFKMQSIFAAVRLLGGSVEIAYLAQGGLVAVCAVAIGWLWFKAVDWRLKSAALLVAAILATPYCLDYDMMVIAPALAMLGAYALQRGFIPYEKTVIACIWLTPLLARTVANTMHVPVGFLSLILLFGWIIRRAYMSRHPEKEQLALA